MSSTDNSGGKKPNATSGGNKQKASTTPSDNKQKTTTFDGRKSASHTVTTSDGSCKNGTLPFLCRFSWIVRV